MTKNGGLLKIDGMWYKQLFKDSTEEFKTGDQINVIFSYRDGSIKWLERRNPSQPDSTNNKGFH